MANHIFISYSRTDQSYARKLAEELRQRAFEVWIDDRIDYGSRWWRTIVKAIHNCAAFIVVMSPAAEESDWVEKEIMLAQDEKKPIFPLLLQGKRFALLINTQYADVTGGRLPPQGFYNRLRKIAPAPTQPPPVSLSPPSASTSPPSQFKLTPFKLKPAQQSGSTTPTIPKPRLLTPKQVREVEQIGKKKSPASHPKTDPNKLACPKCGLPFNRPEDLDAHLRNWHASKAGQPSTAALSPNLLQKISQTLRPTGPETLTCPECGLPFNRQEDLEAHLLNWHSPGAEQPQLSDTIRDRLKSLARSHNPDDLLDCPVCGTPVKARNLVKHFDKTHRQQELREQVKALARASHADDLLPCPVCGTGVKARNLVQHFDRTHT